MSSIPILRYDTVQWGYSRSNYSHSTVCTHASALSNPNNLGIRTAGGFDEMS